MKTLDNLTVATTEFLTPKELRARWKVSAMFLWRLRRKGNLKVYKIGARGLRFSLTEIQKIESEAKA